MMSSLVYFVHKVEIEARMTRQNDQTGEEREKARRIALVKALEFNLVDALHNQGATLLGFAIRYDEFSCLMTLKVDINGVRCVAFIGSDTIMNCVLKADSEAAANRLKWKADKYQAG